MKNSSLSKDSSEMWQLIESLWPICRSITGNGVRETLKIIGRNVELDIHEVPCGTRVFDWEIPEEWNIVDAYILNEQGEKIIDFKVNNLHVVGYSTPVNEWMDLDDLQNHFHSIEDQPNAIPYVTSYYRKYWGICLSHNQRKALKPGKYFVFIDSHFSNGSLTYGEYRMKGECEKEVFFSTYVCHPSMANNELSGPAVVTQLIKWLTSAPRKYSYRVVFIPETIGSIAYLSKHYQELRKNVIAGFNVSCVGDNNNYSYVESRSGNSYADKVISEILKRDHPDFRQFSFLERGSDERQYCSPGIDLPLVNVSRTKYGEYPEYHTSLDNLSYICEEGLAGSLELLKKAVLMIESDQVKDFDPLELKPEMSLPTDKCYKIKTLCEPQLGRRNLYPVLSTKTSVASVKRMMNFIAYVDGTNDVSGISRITGISIPEIEGYVELLKKENLLEVIELHKKK